MKLPFSEPINEEDVREWINTDKQKKLTDEMIANIVNEENESSDGYEDSDDSNLPNRWTKSYQKCY